MEAFEKPKMEKAVLAGLDADVFDRAETATDETLDELEARLETAGGTCTAKVLQHRPAPDPHSFFGEGKAEEIRQLIETTEATMLICDNDLSPSQIRTLEDLTHATVLDRSALILDIFAQRAKTKEGRLQVELAQYQYLLPKLSGMGKSMSRLGLKEVRQVRAVQRERRIKNDIPVVAIVGYTNAGKSTLLNQLTGAGIPANNRLFDTLDTTTRQLEVSDTLTVLLSDTVGFIAKLPHHLVEAFQATLEELQYADLLLHVIDAGDKEREAHIAVVDRLIEQLAKPGTRVLRCYNKCDTVDPDDLPRERDSLNISAKTGENLPALLKAIEKALNLQRITCTYLLPYSMGGMVETLHTQAKVLSTEYTPEGIAVTANCDLALHGRLKDYVRERK